MGCCRSHDHCEPAELIDAVKQEIDHWVSKYPEGKHASAIMAGLTAAQTLQGRGSLTPELIAAVADYLKLPRITAMEVATFYSMYERKPVGRHHICVCTNLPCKLKGSNQIVAHLESRLGIGLGETTPDGKYSLKEVECMGACVNAPMFQIGETYYEHLTPESVDQILDQLDRQDETHQTDERHPASMPGVGGRHGQ
jgi:NADH-quinone oxidoreductase subunit E